MSSRRPLIAGNWKMFGRRDSLGELAALKDAVGGAGAAMDILICPPAPYVAAAVAAAKTPIQIGAQDCSSAQADSARTGEHSAAMLAEVGAAYVIVGHSERRAQHGETDALVRQKAEAVQAAGLIPIICLGETETERNAGRVTEVIAAQLAASVPDAGGNFVVAYEPVWAIGGSRTPTLPEIDEVHGLIRRDLTAKFGATGASTRILYGGSVGPKNAAEIFSCADVDGALVGRASLKAADFSAIILAHPLVTAERSGN